VVEPEPRLSVIVPAYAEAGRIGTTVRALRAALHRVDDDGGLELIVVDDGSPDTTAADARQAGADEVISLPANRGKGAAVRAGMLAARGRTRAFTDADLAYSPDQLLTLLAKVEEGWDVVVGSRRHVEATTLVRARRVRAVGGRAFSLATSWLVLGQERDTQCGLKAFSADAARRIFSRGQLDSFAFDVEIFLLARRWGLKLTEVPVSVQNFDASTVHVTTDALRMVLDLWRVHRWARSGYYDSEHDGEG
jgi:glycosyltransferase involved in cell wall biosynthesis